MDTSVFIGVARLELHVPGKGVVYSLTRNAGPGLALEGRFELVLEDSTAAASSRPTIPRATASANSVARSVTRASAICRPSTS